MRKVVSIKITTHPTNKTSEGYFPVCVQLIFNRKFAAVTLKIPPVQAKSDLIKNDDTGEAAISRYARYYENRTETNEYLNVVLKEARYAVNVLAESNIRDLNPNSAVFM